MSVMVHDRKDYYFIEIDAVKDRIRKALDQTTANLKTKHWPAVGMSANVLRGSMDRVEKIRP